MKEWGINPKWVKDGVMLLGHQRSTAGSLASRHPHSSWGHVSGLPNTRQDTVQHHQRRFLGLHDCWSTKKIKVNLSGHGHVFPPFRQGKARAWLEIPSESKPRRTFWTVLGQHESSMEAEDDLTCMGTVKKTRWPWKAEGLVAVSLPLPTPPSWAYSCTLLQRDNSSPCSPFSSILANGKFLQECVHHIWRRRWQPTPSHYSRTACTLKYWSEEANFHLVKGTELQTSNKDCPQNHLLDSKCLSCIYMGIWGLLRLQVKAPKSFSRLNARLMSVHLRWNFEWQSLNKFFKSKSRLRCWQASFWTQLTQMPLSWPYPVEFLFGVQDPQIYSY